ncbi:outer membrane beta-barrel protein [Niabella aurantiaca]|uniref:outer membrane beta-barrel protein n=1 Tax=Niabella aurantiaca TaxID=379900 RepID=UPI00037D6542|nr:outer membrane beta-barrel protein [Niabella aurantiaca]
MKLLLTLLPVIFVIHLAHAQKTQALNQGSEDQEIEDAKAADIGVQVGPQAGVSLSKNNNAYVGLSLRLTSSGSPLTIQPTFQYVFAENQTLYHLGINLLYEFPFTSRIKPYLGTGVNLSSFKLKAPPTNLNIDDQGSRLGMNLIAGIRFNFPWVSPYLQVKKNLGEFDGTFLGGGIELKLRQRSESISLPQMKRFIVTPYMANNVAGSVQPGRVGWGMSLAFFPWQHLGCEFDIEQHRHFFRDKDVADLVPTQVDLNTSATLYSISMVQRYYLGNPTYGAWCLYATAGAGVIHDQFKGIPHQPGVSAFFRKQTDPTLTGGLGIIHMFTPRVGLRFDARYFHAFVNENANNGGYFKDYDFLRLSTGVTVSFN